jgi:hypothetical protein
MLNSICTMKYCKSMCERSVLKTIHFLLDKVTSVLNLRFYLSIVLEIMVNAFKSYLKLTNLIYADESTTVKPRFAAHLGEGKNARLIESHGKLNHINHIYHIHKGSYLFVAAEIYNRNSVKPKFLIRR